ncbi:hypothetical protein C6361_17880 [Plantactinospora sp. BC1]|nr:hypothetical protein C6361_17880 [Plantactinospora sp. BC1]
MLSVGSRRPVAVEGEPVAPTPHPEVDPGVGSSSGSARRRRPVPDLAGGSPSNPLFAPAPVVGAAAAHPPEVGASEIHPLVGVPAPAPVVGAAPTQPLVGAAEAQSSTSSRCRSAAARRLPRRPVARGSAVSSRMPPAASRAALPVVSRQLLPVVSRGALPVVSRGALPVVSRGALPVLPRHVLPPASLRQPTGSPVPRQWSPALSPPGASSAAPLGPRQYSPVLSQVTSGATRRRSGRPLSVAGCADMSGRWCRPPSPGSRSESEVRSEASVAQPELPVYVRGAPGWSGSVDSRAQDGV